VRLLLDTNALIWWLLDSPLLDRQAHDTIAHPGNDVYVSAVCAWEIAVKLGLGKLRIRPELASWLPDRLAAEQFTPLSITVEHTLGVERLPLHHTDPFDRLLIAQALAEDLIVATADAQFGRYDIRVLRC
jgi:PIN domain nuclease of toxin-antitoxin system